MRVRLLVGAIALVASGHSVVAQVQLDIGTGLALDGQASVDVTLHTGGADVAAVQNDILFDNRVIALTSAADCRINAAISDHADSCDQDPPVGPCKALIRQVASCGGTPQPMGCPTDAGAETSRLRAIVFASGNTNLIPDGIVLYTCTFTVVNAAQLPAPLLRRSVIVSDRKGVRSLDVAGTDGQVIAAPPTPTASATPTATDTATLTATPTDTVMPTATATTLASPTSTVIAPSTATPEPIACVTDCNHDGIVTIDELVTAINIALDLAPRSVCVNADRNDDGQVTTDELITGVNAALNGC